MIRRSRKKLFAALPEQMLFEALLADFAARFADVPAAAIVPEIERALAQLVDLFGYDRCTYSEIDANGTVRVLASAAPDGIEPLRKGEHAAEFVWFRAQLRAGRVVALSAPEALPPEAAAEARHWRLVGQRSHLSIPLKARGRVAGVLSFAGLRQPLRWSADTITRLTIVGEVFAGAVARARSEDEAQQLRLRLWHADRVARVSALTAAIAHEINQPLAAILSNAQAGLANLRRGEARPEEIREILEAIVRDDKRAAGTIRTLRGLLRQDEGGRERVELAGALREVLQLLEAELDRQGIRIELRLEAGCWVRADRAQLEQVALNLVLNAAAAMASRPPQERLLSLTVRRAGGRVAVEVRDTGVGIAAENMQSVFEPFWTTRKDGLGLGLAICRSIIEAHGGTIRAEPNPDCGATFHFELAAGAGAEAGGHAADALPAIAGEASPTPHAGAPLVCIVDDDAAVRESLARRLAAEGAWSVASYASADEFLGGAPVAEVACLLLDLHMPGMSGLELQERLAQHGAPPPIVFLTGHGELASGVAAMKRGAVDFLAKPADEAALFAAVRRSLERHADERSRSLEREACMTRLARLSARERQVMDAVVRGQLNKQIAAELEIALQTVKQHRARVMDKMEASSVAELVRVCEASGLLSRPAP